jgi:hypothetical protein
MADMVHKYLKFSVSMLKLRDTVSISIQFKINVETQNTGTAADQAVLCTGQGSLLCSLHVVPTSLVFYIGPSLS